MLTETKECRYGTITYPPHDRYIGRSLQIYGEYSEHELEFLRLFLRPGDIGLDVGANIGAFTVGMAQKVGPTGAIHAFEPQGAIHEVLRTNVAPLGNVVVHREAAGAAPGVIHVPPRDYDSPGNFGGVSLGGGQGEEVPVVTIDSLKLPRLRLMKIDVEGMEGDVLRGANETIMRCEPALYVENDRDDRSEPLISQIFELGYRLWWHLTPLFSPGNFFKHPEDVFGNMWSVNMIGLPRSVPIQLRFAEVRSPQDVPRAPDGQIFQFKNE
jgi:FkbM family methyltransferase